MTNRDEIMKFFRDESDDDSNLHSLSEHDKYELIMILGSHSSYLCDKFEEAIENYINENEV